MKSFTVRSMSTALGLRLAVIAALLAYTSVAQRQDKVVLPEHRELWTKLTDANTDIVLPEINYAQIMRSEGTVQGKQHNNPLQFAVPNVYGITPDTHGLWESFPDGKQVWSLAITSPNGVNLNLGFTQFFMPPSGTMDLFNPVTGDRIRAFTEADNKPHGQLWTPLLDGQLMVVRVTLLDADDRDDLQLVLSAINNGFLDLPGRRRLQVEQTCNNDVICPEGDPWREQIPAIGRMLVGGIGFCTGSLINDVPQSGTPFFLTAYHCGVQDNPASLVVYWNYERPTCDTTDLLPPEDQFQTGSTTISVWETSDHALFLLDSPPDPAFRVPFLGWDRTGDFFLTATAIHHPNGSPKQISFENDAQTRFETNVIVADPTVLAPDTHIEVTDWDDGTTEPGSSGSPLFDQNQRVIGILTGGGAACGNDLPDFYGRFSTSWDGIASDGLGGNVGLGCPDNCLSVHLDPSNTGVLTTNLFDPFSTVADPTMSPTPPPSPTAPTTPTMPTKGKGYYWKGEGKGKGYWKGKGNIFRDRDRRGKGYYRKGKGYYGKSKGMSKGKGIGSWKGKGAMKSKSYKKGMGSMGGMYMGSWKKRPGGM